MRIGLIVNPIAGLGGKLAWKGTDDINKAWDYVDKGYEQPIWRIVERALLSVKMDVKIIMTRDAQANLTIPDSIRMEIIDGFPVRSSGYDTRKCAQDLVKKGIDILVFAGGDGTAADIAKENLEINTIGIPGGVKIFSGCFLHKPEDLGRCIKNLTLNTTIVDIFDMDEEAYKEGEIRPIIVGSLNVPKCKSIQIGKQTWYSQNDNVTYQGIASIIKENKCMVDKSIILGSGSTMYYIMKEVGIESSLLGIDIIKNGVLIIKDCNHDDIVEYNKKNKIDEIWLSPIGSQGHIFGRGNRQIPSGIISNVKKENIILFSTPEKLIHTPIIHVDTGEHDLDQKLCGFYKIITGYHTNIVRKLSI